MPHKFFQRSDLNFFEEIDTDKEKEKGINKPVLIQEMRLAEAILKTENINDAIIEITLAERQYDLTLYENYNQALTEYEASIAQANEQETDTSKNSSQNSNNRREREAISEQKASLRAVPESLEEQKRELVGNAPKLSIQVSKQAEKTALKKQLSEKSYQVLESSKIIEKESFNAIRVALETEKAKTIEYAFSQLNFAVPVMDENAMPMTFNDTTIGTDFSFYFKPILQNGNQHKLVMVIKMGKYKKGGQLCNIFSRKIKSI